MYINVWTFLEKIESSALVFSKLFTPKEVVTQMHEKSYLSKNLSGHPTHVLRNAVFYLFIFFILSQIELGKLVFTDI